MTSYTSAELSAIAIQVVIALLVIRRSYRMARGVPYSGLRLAALPVLILVLWGFSELESMLLTPWALPYLIVLDLAILIGTTLAFTPVAERMTTVYRESSGVTSYRIGFTLALLFVLVFVVRIALAATLFPSTLQFGGPPAGYPPALQQEVLGVIDALFSVSVGLLVARSAGIQRKWRAAQSVGPISGVQ